MLTITRSFDFCAGHRLHRPDWTDEQNLQVFGACANPAGHGHNYALDVSVSGPTNPETGMVLNLRELKELVWNHVLADVDHKNLNADVPWLKGTIPTTEVFAERIWERLSATLAKHAAAVRLEEIVLHETPKNKVTRSRG